MAQIRKEKEPECQKDGRKKRIKISRDRDTQRGAEKKRRGYEGRQADRGGCARMPVGVAEKRLVHSRSRGRCTMDACTGGGGEAVNTHSRRGRQIDGKHAYRSGGEKQWMYTAGREQVRETRSRCTQQGGEMHRMGRGSSAGKVSRSLNKIKQ